MLVAVRHVVPRLSRQSATQEAADNLTANAPFGLLADAILIVHFLVVVYVIGGLMAGLCWLSFNRPRWAAKRWFRYTHLAAVIIIVLQSWLGVVCPLTTWENALRRRAGQSVYEESFVQYWLHQLLFYSAPWWVFTLIYTLFGLIVALVWWRASQRGVPRGRGSA